MKIKTISIESILKLDASDIKFVTGAKAATANFISSSDYPVPDSLVFVSKSEDLLNVIKNQCSIIVCLEKFIKLPIYLAPTQCLLSVKNIPYAMATILPLVDEKKLRVAAGTAPTAQIHPTAQIGKEVHIGDFVSIAEHAIIEDGVTIAPHSVVESYAQIGKNTYIHPHVVIGSKCIVGESCELNSFSYIGSEGYGLATTPEKKHIKIPQLGIVVLEDHVEIGANCSIDRATLAETRIGSGTKLDNQIHIAHNCSIGKNCRITAGFRIAGSSKIGDNFLCGGGVLITDHVQICNDVTLAGNSVVTNNIEKPGAYGGYPLEPYRDALKTIANISYLTKMRKQLHVLTKHLGLTSTEDL